MRFIFSLIVVVLLAGSAFARIPQAPRLPQGPPVRSVCDCSECGPGCICRFPGECSAHWRKSPNDQYGLFVGDKQIGVWNGEGYYPIVNGQWGKKCKTPPVPLPKSEIAKLPRPAAYIPPRVLGGELVPIPFNPVQGGLPMFNPSGYAVPATYNPASYAPACVGGNCFGGR